METNCNLEIRSEGFLNGLPAQSRFRSRYDLVRIARRLFHADWGAARSRSEDACEFTPCGGKWAAEGNRDPCEVLRQIELHNVITDLQHPFFDEQLLRRKLLRLTILPN